ncbi:carboxymuconolactone decarboxylase [Paucilactobacillus oligofermentans DSM 15707 = LMG 22743]|uniref:Carboxymuconolactone decarboxylase n=1 Tax=Paucilactobacillus oligofermentans DSM 15707 = LMG 22743 TaxID=1423778 RepID=A0A0R1RDG2_9LACO|nr:carboxymuconolactone decarboxylase family protein [Paucilactobacillus oligofermentans]KRL54689.1 carboxymuconolactone decarboxylase [Paucilactobacillus oligofermentans DSM 15707 = LMG 22743]CUS26400.1 Putative carboxymuconolactone decarboxylase family protein [Paucilactobacillus oligofermentans DSM 15707 = LMG 22743]
MTEDLRFNIGLKNLKKVDDKAGQNVIESLTGISEDIGRYIIEFAFGDIYERDVLDLKQREMITITSLLTQGDTSPQLDVHINGSLNVGLTREQIIETFIQAIPYVGFPKVLNAVTVAKKVFTDIDNNKI